MNQGISVLSFYVRQCRSLSFNVTTGFPSLGLAPRTQAMSLGQQRCILYPPWAQVSRIPATSCMLGEPQSGPTSTVSTALILSPPLAGERKTVYLCVLQLKGCKRNARYYRPRMRSGVRNGSTDLAPRYHASLFSATFCLFPMLASATL
jgi:hypothetical protein